MSTPSATRATRPIPNDATLVWLASERTAPLFRTLDRTRAFGPLVVLLSVLPPVLATFAETVTAEDASWGLRALDASGSPLPPQAVGVVEAFVPSEKVRPAALWLSAGLLRLTDPAQPVSASLGSLLGGALLLGMLWPLAKLLGGRRFAFWAVLIAAFHPTLMALLLDPVPLTMALSLGVIALWGHLNLNGKPHRLLLAALLIAASLTAGLLIVGSGALVVAAVIAIDAVVEWLLLVQNPVPARAVRGAASIGTIAVVRVAAAGLGVAAWIAIEQALPDRGVPGDGTMDAASLVGELTAMPLETVVIGPLWGLAVVGFGRLLRVLSRRSILRMAWPAPRLLFVWSIAAGIGVLWTSSPLDDPFDPESRYSIALFSLPFLLTAAYAIEEAARRMISGAWLLLAVALPLAMRLGSVMATFPHDGPGLWIVLGALGLAAAWIFARVIPAIVPQTGMRRGVLMSAVLLAIGINSADGLGVLFRPQNDDAAYRHLIADLEPHRGSEAVVLLTASAPPPELVYALRATFPEAAMEIATSWDEAASRLESRSGLETFSVVVTAWGMREGLGANSAEELLPSGEPMLFSDRELLLYTSTDRSTTRASAPATLHRNTLHRNEGNIFARGLPLRQRDAIRYNAGAWIQRPSGLGPETGARTPCFATSFPPVATAAPPQIASFATGRHRR